MISSNPDEGKKVAFLIEKGVSSKRMCEIMKQAAEYRADGKQVLVSRMNKNKKFQKEQLEKDGYMSDKIKEYYYSDFKN